MNNNSVSKGQGMKICKSDMHSTDVIGKSKDDCKFKALTSVMWLTGTTAVVTDYDTDILGRAYMLKLRK